MGPANVVDCVRYDNEDAMRGFSLGGRKAPTESSIQSGRCKVRHYFRRKLRQSPRHEWGVRHRAGIEDNNYSLAACDPTLFSVLTVLEGLVVELRGSVRGGQFPRSTCLDPTDNLVRNACNRSLLQVPICSILRYGNKTPGDCSSVGPRACGLAEKAERRGRPGHLGSAKNKEPYF